MTPTKKFPPPPPLPSSSISTAAGVKALLAIRNIAASYPEWTPPGPDLDHTPTLALWIRCVDELKRLRTC